jgi:hypothetical protein
VPAAQPQVDGLQHGAPHVVLALGVGLVANPDRAGAIVAAEVAEHPLGEPPLTVHPVDHLHLAVPLGDVGQEPEEVVGLPVEAERVQAPQRERGITQPAEPVVPVPLAARHLGQRGGGRGDHGPAGRERQPLEGQRAALQVPAPRMVREPAPGQPVLPVVRGPDQPAAGVGVAERRLVAGPGQRHEVMLTLPHPGSGHGPAALEAKPHVGGQGQPGVGVGGGRPADALRVVPVGVLPAPRVCAVAEHRLAVEGDLDLAGDAADRAQQHVVGVVVGRRAAVRVRQFGVVVPGAHQQRVTDHQPAGRGGPAGLQHHRPRQVAPGGGHADPLGAEPEAARRPVQHRAEHAGRVHPRQAQPLHVPAGGDQRGGLAVRQEAVLADRRERGFLGQRLPRPGVGQVEAVPIPGHPVMLVTHPACIP